MPSSTSAEEFVPHRVSLKSLGEAADHCRGCELYRHATQTVFGEGPRRASLLMLGEMPGDEEDKQGHPFVGPAGRLLDDAIGEAGLSRSDVYVTNAVKHFRWESRGKRRLHKKPSARQIKACKPWLQAEILVVRPEVIVCLGATAAQVMLGREFRITKQRGKFFKHSNAAWLMTTYHPSAVLRAPDRDVRQRMHKELVEDLQRAAEHFNRKVKGIGRPRRYGVYSTIAASARVRVEKAQGRLAALQERACRFSAQRCHLGAAGARRRGRIQRMDVGWQAEAPVVSWSSRRQTSGRRRPREATISCRGGNQNE